MPGFNLNDYITVDERIDQFWAEHKDDGAITTELIWVGDTGQSVAIRASVEVGGRVVATGIAQEDRGPKGANQSSWWENAETSAIGRALANYGMSLSKARPSREEMAKVQRAEQSASRPAPRQEPRPLRPSAPAAGATPEQVAAVRDALAEKADHETPEGALAWLAGATDRDDLRAAHAKARQFVTSGMMSLADVAKAYNEADSRLRAATA